MSFRRIVRAITMTGLITTVQVACQDTSHVSDRIDFLFSKEEQRVYQALLQDPKRTDFSLSVRMGEGLEPLAATAHFRGQSSYRCERKNYTLNLQGRRPGSVLTDSATDEFFLLSLCKDDYYVRQHTVLQLWTKLGLFPLDFRYVELTIEGESRGVYLLVEKLDRLRIVDDELLAVLRRGSRRGQTHVELKYSHGTVKSPAADYNTFTQSLSGLSGTELLAAFRERMDVDQYLLWVATNTLLRNGDSVDELWLLVQDHVDPRGRRSHYYRFAGWDPEDIFKPCHFEGRNAFVDPNGLVYCAEAEWDHYLFSDPLCYEYYIDILEDVIENRLTEAMFQAACERTGNELSRFLSRPQVSAAMIELIATNPQTIEPAVAKAEIQKALQELLFNFSRERVKLVERIAAYRDSLIR